MSTLTWSEKDTAYGKPGYANNVSDIGMAHVSSFRKLPLDTNAYVTGGWVLTKGDTRLDTVQDVKVLTRTPGNRTFVPAAVMPEITIDKKGVVTLKLNKVNGASFAEVANGYTGPAGSALWLEFIGFL